MREKSSLPAPILGYDENRTTLFKPHGMSVSERLYATLHIIVAMHSDIKQQKWASLLPLEQLAYDNKSYGATIHKTLFFLMFGREARLPLDIIPGLSHLGRDVDSHVFVAKT